MEKQTYLSNINDMYKKNIKYLRFILVCKGKRVRVNTRILKLFGFIEIYSYDNGWVRVGNHS